MTDLKIPLKFKSATYLKPNSKFGLSGDLQIYPDSTAGATEGQLGFAVVADEHNIDWSDTTINRGNHEASKISETVSHALFELTSEFAHDLILSDLPNRLLSAYQLAHASAEKVQIAASVLTAVWIERTLHVASVGVCRAYLIRNGSIENLNIDDYARMILDDVPHTSSNLLSNAIGLGSLRTTDDIHLHRCSIEPGDTLLLSNKTFYKNVSDQEILDAERGYPEVDELCLYLGTNATQRADAFALVSLCVVKFQ